MTPEQWQVVKTLFESVLERPPEERPAFVAQATDDPELRRELESLIAADRADGFLDEAGGLRAAAAVVGAAALAGRRIGAYRIVKPIGEGGMGVVYLAERDDEAYEKQAAIKVVRPGALSESALRRFRHERQIVASLDHPYIAKLFDGGATPDGLPYFVLEHVDGVPIDDWCERGVLPIADRLRLFRLVCSAIQHAHEHGIVHRDLKPSNILVARDGTPKLLDFGIAKELGREPAPSGTLTGAAMMTPEYASPEQIRGDAITPAADVYALGVVLYRLLTGISPYRVRTGTPHELAQAICEQEPVGPATAARTGEPARARPIAGLSRDLDAVVLKALRKEPAQRYASVAALSDDIAQCLDGCPVAARKGTVSYRTAKFLKRNIGAIASTTAVAGMVIVASITISMWRSPQNDASARPARLPSIAVLPLKNLSQDPEQEYLGDGITQALIADLSNVGALRVIARTSVMRYKGTAKALPDIARELNVAGVVTGSFLRTGNRIRITAELVESATNHRVWAETYERDLQDLLLVQTELARTVATEAGISLTPEERARLQIGRQPDSAGNPSKRPEEGEAYAAYLKGRHMLLHLKASDSIRLAIKYFEHAAELDPDFALAYAGLADAYATQVDYDRPAPEAQALSKQAAERAFALDPNLPEAWNSLAQVATSEWKWLEAERLYKKAIASRPGNEEAHHAYSHLLMYLGRHDEALAESKRLLALDPLSPHMNAHLGFDRHLAGRLDEAAAQLERAVKVDPSYVRSWVYLGRVYVDQQRFPEAITALQKAVSLRGTSTEGLDSLARAYILSGDREAGLNILRQLVHEARTRYVSPLDLARVYTALGNHDEAISLLEQAYAARSGRLALLKVTPEFKPLHDDPRFASLLKRIGL